MVSVSELQSEHIGDSMDLCAVGCCTRDLISVLYIPVTVRSGRKCSLLRLYGLQLSAECRKRFYFPFPHVWD